MTDNRKTCVDPYLDSFAQSFAKDNYKPRTIKEDRQLVEKLGRLMDAAGIPPSALTPELADQLARTVKPRPRNKVRFYNLARRFAGHLIEIGVAEPIPLTEAQFARKALLADFETYLVKQRGLSSCTICSSRSHPTESRPRSIDPRLPFVPARESHPRARPVSPSFSAGAVWGALDPLPDMSGPRGRRKAPVVRDGREILLGAAARPHLLVDATILARVPARLLAHQSPPIC